VRVDPNTGTLIREGVPFIINPFDTHAIEAALRLKDQYGLRVTALTMGPPTADEILRKALSLGVDEAVLLSDRAFAGADTWATSAVLAEAIRRLAQKEEIAMVMCGKQTIDGDTAQVGPGIANRLDYHQLTLVDRIVNLDLVSGRIRVRRKLEGRHEIVEAPLPAMVAVVREINQCRYPTVPRKLVAADADITAWDNSVLRLDPETIGLKGSPTQVRKIFSPERVKGEVIGDGLNAPEEAANLLVDTLIEKNILSV
jgi:electron transfer flavoprotein beta subunit